MGISTGAGWKRRMKMRMREPRFIVLAGVIALGLIAYVAPSPLAASPDQAQSNPTADASRLAESVRHELAMLPYYLVFDNLQYQLLDDGTVVLSGEVSRPYLKSDAENVVKRISGVKGVTNNIEVLPLSPFDSGIRWAVFRALYGNPVLSRYRIMAMPPIRIVVKNGDVTLEGVVLNELEKNMAGIVANGVPGIFKVTNNLRVENSKTAAAAIPGGTTKTS